VDQRPQALSRRLQPGRATVASLESNYQRDKHEKDTEYGEMLQCFEDLSTSAIRHDLDETLLHGRMEIGDTARINS
jgi:hypothetical protein